MIDKAFILITNELITLPQGKNTIMKNTRCEIQVNTTRSKKFLEQTERTLTSDILTTINFLMQLNANQPRQTFLKYPQTSRHTLLNNKLNGYKSHSQELRGYRVNTKSDSLSLIGSQPLMMRWKCSAVPFKGRTLISHLGRQKGEREKMAMARA